MAIQTDLLSAAFSAGCWHPFGAEGKKGILLRLLCVKYTADLH